MSTVTTEHVEARVVETFTSFGPGADQISRESTFHQLDIDSLDPVELAQVVEDEYGVVLKGEDRKELKTVGGGDRPNRRPRGVTPS
jgi:acyl carrier protein